MNIVKATEVRTTRPVTVTTEVVGYFGPGVERETFSTLFGVNAGHPTSLHNRTRNIDGVLTTGKVKVTKMQHTPGADYFSFRTIGGGERRTVYLRGDAKVMVDGMMGTVSEFWTLINA